MQQECQMFPAALLSCVSITVYSKSYTLLTIDKCYYPHHDVGRNERLFVPHSSGSFHFLDTILGTSCKGFDTAVAIRVVDRMLDVHYWGLTSLDSFVDVF